MNRDVIYAAALLTAVCVPAIVQTVLTLRFWRLLKGCEALVRTEAEAKRAEIAHREALTGALKRGRLIRVEQQTAPCFECIELAAGKCWKCGRTASAD